MRVAIAIAPPRWGGPLVSAGLCEGKLIPFMMEPMVIFCPDHFGPNQGFGT